MTGLATCMPNMTDPQHHATPRLVGYGKYGVLNSDGIQQFTCRTIYTSAELPVVLISTFCHFM